MVRGRLKIQEKNHRSVVRSGSEKSGHQTWGQVKYRGTAGAMRALVSSGRAEHLTSPH
jgi:hypothetical protein